MSQLSPTWYVFPPARRASSLVHKPALHPTTVTLPHQNTGDIIHPPTQVTIQSARRSRTLSADVTYPPQNTARIQSAPRPRTASLPPQNNGNIIHPVTQVGVRSAHNGSRQTQPAVVVTQPAPVPVMVTCLRDSPALVRCPHCHHTVTSKVEYVPGRSAWCLCVLISLMGLICGFCLIPFMIRGLQDAHHSCPRCGKPLHVFTR
ncbi:hypothetical protein INR49_032828 [Caranx melampygus]|nr:hypothetical protein INR49_032828 [Caranx melampygus]